MVDDHFVGLFISFDGSHIVHGQTISHRTQFTCITNSNQKLCHRQFACARRRSAAPVYVSQIKLRHGRKTVVLLFFALLAHNTQNVCALYFATRFIHCDRRSLTSSGCQVFFVCVGSWHSSFQLISWYSDIVDMCVTSYKTHARAHTHTHTINFNNFVIMTEEVSFPSAELAPPTVRFGWFNGKFGSY